MELTSEDILLAASAPIEVSEGASAENKSTGCAPTRYVKARQEKMTRGDNMIAYFFRSFHDESVCSVNNFVLDLQILVVNNKF